MARQGLRGEHSVPLPSRSWFCTKVALSDPLSRIREIAPRPGGVATAMMVPSRNRDTGLCFLVFELECGQNNNAAMGAAAFALGPHSWFISQRQMNEAALARRKGLKR